MRAGEVMGVVLHLEGTVCFSFPSSDPWLPLSCPPLGLRCWWEGDRGDGGVPLWVGIRCWEERPVPVAASARRSGLRAVFFPPVAFLRRVILAWQVFSEASNFRSQLKDPEGTAVARSVANILLGKKKSWSGWENVAITVWVYVSSQSLQSWAFSSPPFLPLLPPSFLLLPSFFFSPLIGGVANWAGSVNVMHLLLYLILVLHLDFPGKGNPGKSHKHWLRVEFMQHALFWVWLQGEDEGTRRLGYPCPQAP